VLSNKAVIELSAKWNITLTSNGSSSLQLTHVADMISPVGNGTSHWKLLNQN